MPALKGKINEKNSYIIMNDLCFLVKKKTVDFYI